MTRIDYSQLNHAEKLLYFEGYKEALWSFAYWKDGDPIVGCGTFTYKRALEIKGQQIFGDEWDEIQSNL